MPRTIYVVIEKDGDIYDYSIDEREAFDKKKETPFGREVIPYIPKTSPSLEDVRKWIKDGIYPSQGANMMLLDEFDRKFGIKHVD